MGFSTFYLKIFVISASSFLHIYHQIHENILFLKLEGLEIQDINIKASISTIKNHYIFSLLLFCMGQLLSNISHTIFQINHLTFSNNLLLKLLHLNLKYSNLLSSSYIL